MELFAADDDAELVGIGASIRGGREWFQVMEQIQNDSDGASVSRAGHLIGLVRSWLRR